MEESIDDGCYGKKEEGGRGNKGDDGDKNDK